MLQPALRSWTLTVNTKERWRLCSRKWGRWIAKWFHRFFSHVVDVQSTRKSLFIASEVRSGSTYIAETLAYQFEYSCDLAAWDLTREPFSQLDSHSAAAQALDIRNTLHLNANDFVFAKVMCKALSVIEGLAQKSPEVREAFFGDGAYWVVVRRRDPVAQAVSLALAEKTGLFHAYDKDAQTADQLVELSMAEIEAALKAILLSDIFLESFAANLPPERSMTIFYDDFMADEAGYVSRVNNLCGFPPFDPNGYVNRSKIIRTASKRKQKARDEFVLWFLANYI